MTDFRHYLPLRRTRGEQSIETRPLHVEEWLDTLPYIDFNKTGRILEEATRATNQQPLKPATRLELVELYSRPYLYYVESQIKTGAQHTLQSIEIMQDQIGVLRGIAVNLAYAATLVMEDSLNKKKIWPKPRPPLRAMLFSMNYLSHALIFSFQEYTQAPKGIWKKLHHIYELAASLSQETTTVDLPDGDVRHKSMSVSQAYKRILLSALADPYHLPFGAVWEVFDQLSTWTDHTSLGAFREIPNPTGQFVINLDSDTAAIPYNKFNIKAGGDRHRLLDTTALVRHIDDTLLDWGRGKPFTEKSSLSPYYAHLILNHLSRSWGLPPKRNVPRRQSSGSVSIAYGVNAACYLFNGEREFQMPRNPLQMEEIVADDVVYDDVEDITLIREPKIEQYERIDEGAGGIAIMKQDKLTGPVHVGELVTVMPERTDPSTWSLGVVRWLMTHQTGQCKKGIQILSDTVEPAAIRSNSGSDMDRRFRPCLLLPAREEGEPTTVIAAKGLYIQGRELEIITGRQQQQVQAGQLLERTVVFEHFRID